MKRRKESSESSSAAIELVPARAPELPVLPECAQHRDEVLVDAVVGKIQVILARTVARGMDEVGQLLLREFFNNDPDLYSSTSSAKHVSLRSLLERCGTIELPVRRTFLANALQMTVFARKLPKGAQFFQLPPSHRVELMRLGSPARAETLATTAVEQQMTVQKLRAAVRRERKKQKSKRGRPPQPPLLRSVSQCVRLLRDTKTGRLSFHRDALDALSPPQRAAAKALAESLSKRLSELLKLLD